MLIAAIVVCEVAFWVFLVAGLIGRYLLHRPRLGLVLLAASPVADVILLGLTAFDLQRGAVATQVHAIAALYLGFAVAFGHRLVEAADRRFAHRFAGGPPPVRVPRTGPERVAYEWREFRRAVLAWAVSCAVLGALILLIGDLQRAQALLAYLGVVSVVLIIWLVTGPLPAVLPAARHNEIGHQREEET